MFIDSYGFWSRISGLSCGPTLDYYLERAAVKMAALSGAFSKLLILLFFVIILCSFIMWLIIPFIEIRKKMLLNRIYERLGETQELLLSIREKLDSNNKLR